MVASISISIDAGMCILYDDVFCVYYAILSCITIILYFKPWRIFDELHIYNFTANRWTLVIGSISHPFPTAGHGASISGDRMIIFGGRIFNQDQQSYPLSDAVWIFDFISKEWMELQIVNSSNQAGPAPGIKPTPRYGHTQITLDEEHVLVVGGCGGPNLIFSDVWLLTLIHTPGGRTPLVGRWDRVQITNSELFTTNDFHYQGCKVMACTKCNPYL